MGPTGRNSVPAHYPPEGGPIHQTAGFILPKEGSGMAMVRQGFKRLDSGAATGALPRLTVAAYNHAMETFCRIRGHDTSKLQEVG